MNGHEMVMPFVTVTSKGGPHDDDSYTAGWEMGALDSLLAVASSIATKVRRTIRTENRPQADLIAMRYGYTLTVTDEHHGGWLSVTLDRQDHP